jgi:hypothetical protein
MYSGVQDYKNIFEILEHQGGDLARFAAIVKQQADLQTFPKLRWGDDNDEEED